MSRPSILLTCQNRIPSKARSKGNQRNHCSSPSRRMRIKKFSIIPKSPDVLSRGLWPTELDMESDFSDLELSYSIVFSAMVFPDYFGSFIHTVSWCKPAWRFGNEEAAHKYTERRNCLQRKGNSPSKSRCALGCCIDNSSSCDGTGKVEGIIEPS